MDRTLLRNALRVGLLLATVTFVGACSNRGAAPLPATVGLETPVATPSVAPTRTPVLTPTLVPARILGQSDTLENGLTVTPVTFVYNPKLTENGEPRTPPAGFEFLLVELRVELRSVGEARGPRKLELAVSCANGTAGPTYKYSAVDALDLERPFVLGEAISGKVLLGVPANCEMRRLRARPAGAGDGFKENIKTRYWTLP